VKRFGLVMLLVTVPARAEEDELARARFLDQQGVRAFAESRFRDAAALFSESFRAGGPPTELWNLARCQLKVEDVEAARHTLETYLEQKTLTEGDRAEGKRLLDELEHRSSMLVVASTPQGAFVTVDGHVVGMTPLTSTLAPGLHELKVSRENGPSTTRHLDAHDGRSFVISVELGAIEHAQPKPPTKHTRRFSAELGALGVVSVLGGGTVVEPTVSPEISLGYAAFVSRRSRLGFGIRVRGAYDSWSTSLNVSNTTLGCTPGADYSAVELLAMPTVFGALNVAKHVTVGARIGFGAAIYASGTPIGGDLFAPACAYGGSLAPDGYAALDVSLGIVDAIRVVFFPATLDLHASYVGARSDSVVDATGVWMRIGIGVALAVDL
jgi:hypothetical protein